MSQGEFDLVVNLTTAKALGLTVPPSAISPPCRDRGYGGFWHKLEVLQCPFLRRLWG
jgi:hypothetical protein